MKPLSVTVLSVKSHYHLTYSSAFTIAIKVHMNVRCKAAISSICWLWATAQIIQSIGAEKQVIYPENATIDKYTLLQSGWTDLKIHLHLDHSLAPLHRAFRRKQYVREQRRVAVAQ